ncbi:lysosomal acid glucosylceramidase-like [Thrips palmi]|uniref:Glucosylceramidase n=1 Tax=Thrips palmi TaxID=161013 RepID=A0A6P8YX33_THRPL|nr:lysosomal acid glucosylceramidase-like [Thrips palmi]
MLLPLGLLLSLAALAALPPEAAARGRGWGSLQPQPQPLGHVRPCEPRDYGQGSVVCVCNATYCDDVPRPRPSPPGVAVMYASNKDGLRFERSELAFDAKGTTRGSNPAFTVTSNVRFQAIIGWGATVTDSTGINLKALSEDARRNLIESYFSEDGIEYNILRIPIGGTDCSTHKYTLHDAPEDAALGNFSLAFEDHEYKLPLLREAREAVPADRPLQLLASAWTAPPWMKTNNDYTGFGFLKTEHYQTWANYHLKFLDAYEAEGFHFWGLTTGNEPMNGVVGPLIRFNSMGWTPFQMRSWVGDYLGPTLRGPDRRASKHADVRILTLDDQRIDLPWWTDIVFSYKNASAYVDGIALHWYTNYFTPLLGLDMSHENHPDKFILGTEASSGFNNWDFRKVILGSWKRAEDYIVDILDDLNHWVTGWMEWSLVLDMEGGPSWSGNFVDTSILVDAENDEFVKQPTFYAIGHFSKFLAPGSVRVKVEPESSQGVRTVAFARQDGATVVIFFNSKDANKTVTVSDVFRGAMQIPLTPRSINTVLYW